jgi:hypothetical protein
LKTIKKYRHNKREYIYLAARLSLLRETRGFPDSPCGKGGFLKLLTICIQRYLNIIKNIFKVKEIIYW